MGTVPYEQSKNENKLVSFKRRILSRPFHIRSVAAFVSCHSVIIVAAVIVIGLGTLFLLFALLFSQKLSSHLCDTLRELLPVPFTLRSTQA